MAQCKQTPQEFIRNCFTPQVAVVSTPLAEEACKKNNLSFIEMIQPFCKLGTEVHYKDATGVQVSIRNLKITLVDIAARPPPPALARRYLNASVSEAANPKYETFDAGEYKLDVPSGTPWFESWRDTFFQVQFPSDHEFTKHFLACILVVSSKDNNPLETMINLAQSLNTIMQDTSPTKLPKWFNNRVMRYYVILHENTNGNHVSAVECFDAMRVSYGRNSCFLLRMNSRVTVSSEQLPDPWSQFLQSRLPVSYETRGTPDSSPNVERAMSASWEKSDDGSTLGYHPLSPETETNPVVENSVESRESEDALNVLHGACLSTEDVEQIKLLVYEFCTKALLPFIEKEINQLSDYVTNKRVSRSLLSATKRWFTPSKSGSNNVAVSTLIYTEDAPELQVRRLADLYFMFGNYSMAYQSYHIAKKEYQNDQAWLYYAGTLEMAGLSAFMCNESSRKILDNFEEAIVTYLNMCKLAQFATRATLLSTECMKSRGLFGEAAHHFIRMTSEESDLRSALLLEQACYCFLQCTKPLMFRKYAFHMVLAGHRFSKAAQKKHALRCYTQASQIYIDKGWNLAEDHVNFTIGRQANNLHLLEQAVNAFASMLSGRSKQNSQQQEIFLKEYLSAHIAFSKSQNAILTQVLPLPLLKTNATKVLVGPVSPLRTPGKVPAQGVVMDSDQSDSTKWLKLEEMLVYEAQGSLPMIFKPLTTLFTKKNTTMNPIGIMGEPIQVSIQLSNPLEIPLLLKEIYLLWQYKDKNNRFAANEIMGNEIEHMRTISIKTFTLPPNSTQELILSITPLAVGEVVLKGVCYLLCCSSSDLSVKGKQVFSESKDSTVNKRFEINIVPSAPCLQVYFGEIHTDVIRNQIQQITVELRNVSNIALTKIYLATSVPELISVIDFQSKSFDADSGVDMSSPAAREKEARKNHVSCIRLPNGRLEPGQCHNVSLWLKAPDSGDSLADILIYYENITGNTPQYRLIRHTWNLKVQESMKLDCAVERSSNSKEVEQVTFALKVQNLNKFHNPSKIEINLYNAALLSENWELLDEMAPPKNNSIRFEESEYVFLKAKRKVGGPNYSDISFVNSNPEEYSNNAYLDFAKRRNEFRINVFQNCDTLDKPTKNEGVLMVRWQAYVIENNQKKVAYGQTITSVSIVEEESPPVEPEEMLFNMKESIELRRNVEEEKVTELTDRKLVMCNVLHPVTVEYDFNQNKLCIVPVKLLLHSISPSKLIVTIDALDTSNSNPAVSQRPILFYPNSSKNFRWIKSGKVLKMLQPLGTSSVDLFVAVVAPGTYDLGARLSISCRNAEDPKNSVPQISRVESSLVITST